MTVITLESPRVVRECLLSPHHVGRCTGIVLRQALPLAPLVISFIDRPCVRLTSGDCVEELSLFSLSPPSATRPEDYRRAPSFFHPCGLEPREELHHCGSSFPSPLPSDTPQACPLDFRQHPCHFSVAPSKPRLSFPFPGAPLSLANVFPSRST